MTLTENGKRRLRGGLILLVLIAIPYASYYALTRPLSLGSKHPQLHFVGIRNVAGEQTAIFNLQSDTEIAYAGSASGRFTYRVLRGGAWVVVQPDGAPTKPDKVLRPGEVADYIVPLRMKDGILINGPFSAALTTWRPPGPLNVELHRLTSSGDLPWPQNTVWSGVVTP